MEHRRRDPEFHRTGFSGRVKLAMVLAAVGLLVLVAVVPQGNTPGDLRGRVVEEDGGSQWVRDLDPVFNLGLVLGYLSGYLLLGSLLFGHRRPMGWLLPGRWRTRIHVSIGGLLLVLAALHGGILTYVGAFETWPSGLASVLVLGLHGASGFRKTSLVCRWGARRWRFVHLLTAYLGLALGLVHSLAF